MRESHQQDAIGLMREVLCAGQHLKHYAITEDALISLVWAHEARGEFSEALGYMRRLIEHIVERRRHCLEILSRSNSSPNAADFDRPLLPLKYRESMLEAAAIRSESRNERLEMLQRLAMAATLRDDASGMHGYRVGKLSALLASKLGWSINLCYELDMAARLHDIGKTAVPDHILLHPGPLKNIQRDLIQAHPQVGATLLIDARDSESRLAAEIALNHHERWDGRGYPKGVAGAKIPIAARIVAIADVFDTLTHGRPYAAPSSIEAALVEVRALSSAHFDPDLIEPFSELIAELTARHANLDAFLEAEAATSPFVIARKKIATMIRKDREALHTNL